MRKLVLIFCILGMGEMTLGQTYLPLTGGTLTGHLTGTTATFEASFPSIDLVGLQAAGRSYSITPYILGVSNAGFSIRDNTSGINVFSIDGTGNVGINTSTPSEKLTVNGTIGLQYSGTQTWHVFANSSNGLSFTRSGIADRMVITSDGDVGIGTTSPSEKLSVNGKIRAKEIKVETSGWSDFVFEPDYKLPDLRETERFIKENKHLPEIPSAAEVEKNGINLGEMNARLLQKIEELTLYLIESKKEVKDLQERVKSLEGKK